MALSYVSSALIFPGLVFTSDRCYNHMTRQFGVSLCSPWGVSGNVQFVWMCDRRLLFILRSIHSVNCLLTVNSECRCNLLLVQTFHATVFKINKINLLTELVVWINVLLWTQVISPIITCFCIQALSAEQCVNLISRKNCVGNLRTPNGLWYYIVK